MRLPTSKDRTLITGRTGSGKTQGAVWLLSHSNYLSAPWIVLNHKNTALIDDIPGARHVDNSELPKKPGIYVYHPIPGRDDDEVEKLLFHVWARGHMGVYVDEGYMIDPRSDMLNACYTQGREKHIPMITLSQRPSGISRFAISEAEFFMLFHIIERKDRDRVRGFIPTDLEALMHSDAGEDRMLPEYHSLYFDVAKNRLEILRPVPPADIILQSFEDRLKLSRGKNRLI